MMTEIRRSIARSPREPLSLRLHITDCSEFIEGGESGRIPQEESKRHLALVHQLHKVADIGLRDQLQQTHYWRTLQRV